MRYIWQDDAWPVFTYDVQALAVKLAEASFQLGRFQGELSNLGFDLKSEAVFHAVSSEIIESAAIEGESLNREDVRSSVARRMELAIKDLPHTSSHAVDARVEMMMDATRGWRAPMTRPRLCAWHAALFPTGYSGLSKIQAGRLRDDSEGPMRVVSRHGSLERVHFEAPPATALKKEMSSFLDWLNASQEHLPPLVKVAMAHMRFLTLHPFDDGNGRLARALTEYLLAQMERSDLRFYSLSAQIQKEKSDYYAELEHAQRHTLDVTRWVEWFLGLHMRAVASAEELLATILAKARFWREHAHDVLNEHQKDMLNRLLDGFDGHLTSSKWAKICKVSQDTASREIQTLVGRNILRQVGKGRTTHYVLSQEPKIKNLSKSFS